MNSKSSSARPCDVARRYLADSADGKERASAGGAYQPALLPAFWRALSDALPNGAGTDAVRRLVYFASTGITQHLLVLAVYVLAGAAVTMLGSRLVHGRRATYTQGAVSDDKGMTPEHA